MTDLRLKERWLDRHGDTILAGVIVIALIVGVLVLMVGIAFAVGFVIRYVADILG